MRLRPRIAGLFLLLAQLVLVLTVAANYLYERRTCPRVWVRAGQYDPEMLIRGRYLALQPLLDGCALPRDRAHYIEGWKNPYNAAQSLGHWTWTVTLSTANGQLVPHLATPTTRPSDTFEATLWDAKPCNRTSVNAGLDYFIPELTKGPFPFKSGEELWVEVTVPPSGPPRPIQLAVSSATGFQVLALH